MTERSAIDDPVDRLHGFLNGFHATYYVYTGVECGLFRALTDPTTPAELAAALGLHRPYVERFCEAGLRWGILPAESAVDGATDPGEPSAGTANAQGAADAADAADATDAMDEEGAEDVTHAFRLREPFVQPLAEPDAVQYMGDLFRFTAGELGSDYSDYPEHFATGETRPAENRGAAFTEVIEGSTRGLQTIFVEKLVPEDLPAFDARLSAGGRILDVGCGTGLLACRLCERDPDVSVVGVDVDSDAVSRARDRAAAAGVKARTTFMTADAMRVAAAATAEFDAAVLFMSLHEVAAERRPELFGELGSALASDGVVAVFDEVYPDSPSKFDREPLANGVETQWAELVWGTDVPTAAEQRDLLAAAGVTEESRSTFADRFVTYEGVPNP